jgi:acetyl esterase/lipase
MKLAAFLSLSLLLATSAEAQQSFPPSKPIPTPVQQGAFPLDPTAKDGARGEQWATIGDDTSARNVTRATLQPFLPPAGKGTGAAVIVAPGGAFMALSMDNEGWKVAQWLADHGIAAFVLKYRLDPTPEDEKGFAQQIGARVAGASATAGNPTAPMDPDATADGIAAIALVRKRAAEWHIDPHKVGFIGFSAGAELTRRMALAADPGQRPDFAGMIYGPLNAAQVPADAPPLFTAIAADDPIFGKTDFGLVQAWRAAARPVELHYYDHGAHGFGMRKQNSTSDLWIEEFHAWMGSRGLAPR